MVTAKHLREEYEKKLKHLQDTCKHPKISDWLGEEWAIAHSTGFQVKICDICWKTIIKKGRCGSCGKEFEGIPQYGSLCPDCAKKMEDKRKKK